MNASNFNANGGLLNGLQHLHLGGDRYYDEYDEFAVDRQNAEFELEAQYGSFPPKSYLSTIQLKNILQNTQQKSRIILANARAPNSRERKSKKKVRFSNSVLVYETFSVENYDRSSIQLAPWTEKDHKVWHWMKASLDTDLKSQQKLPLYFFPSKQSHQNPQLACLLSSISSRHKIHSEAFKCKADQYVHYILT